MIFNKKYILYAITLVVALGLSGCSGGYEPSPNMVTLKATFADSKWDGVKVPKNEVCSDYNKNGGNTPAITISNLPSGTTKVVLSFSDNNPRAKMMNGGHGIVGYKIATPTTTLTIPSIKGETFDLPENFESIKAHVGTQWGKTAGAYLPPCSGGRGNPYDVKVEAIHEYQETDKKPMLLGDTKLQLGIY